MPLNQSNQITLQEIHTRTELWKDKIYYISNSPYWNKDYQFLPLPKRFASILQEFRAAVDKQKASETSEEDRQEAQQTISNIYQQIRALIEEEIEQVEAWELDLEPLAATATEEEIKEQTDFRKNWIQKKETKLKQLKLGLTKKTITPLRTLNDEHLEDNQYQITQLLNQWETNKKVVDDRKNICFILQDTQDTFQFCYQPPKGNFPALQDFLWYRNNIWYETTNWQRINHENAIITAKRSHFIHNYSKFFGQGANGVLHHSPKFGNKDEICQCPAFLESTEFVEFCSDWQPEYKLFKIKSFSNSTFQTELYNKPYGVVKRYPVFHTLDLEEVKGMEYKGLYTTNYFILPKWYKTESMTDMRTYRIEFKNSRSSLEDWLRNSKMERMGHDGTGGQYEHLLKHVNVNYFWNDKKIHESTLDEIDWNNFRVMVRANPAGIMYRFKSNKVFFRYSEDLTFALEANKIQGLGVRMGTKMVDGVFKIATAGMMDPETSKAVEDVGKTTEDYLHGKDDNDKSKDERQSERKKALASAGVQAVSSVIGSIPSILDASHTHGDYSLAEIALRFNSIQFKIRLEFNKNLCNRYQMMKGLKKNGNQPFNVKKIGNIFSKGYYKIVPNIFQGDKDGFFASIFSKGVYLYEKDPDEYFLEPLESGKFERGILNDTPVMTNTTIQTNYKSTIGRDNSVHIDDLSWVRKDSYCRATEGENREDIFPQLIDGMRHNIKKESAGAWKFNGYSKGESSAQLQKGVKYEWYMHAFSSGEVDSKTFFEGLEEGVKVILKQDGADWELAFEGRVEVAETVGNPDAIGQAVEIDDFEETLPELEDENQTEGLDNLEQNMEPKPETGLEKEPEEEIEPEPEPEAQKEEELEQEEERTEEKTKEKHKEKEEEEEETEPEYSGDKEK